MVTIKKKKSIFSLTENWFEYKFKFSDLFLPVCYRGLRDDSSRQLYFGIKKHTKTVVLPLDKSMEDIHANFSKTLKAHIKKATAQGIHCYINNDIKAFQEFYNPFAKIKNLFIMDSSRSHEFAIDEWKSSYAVVNEQILAAHSYLEDKESGIVRLMESGSMRLNDQYDPMQISHANKLLHYHDIQYFKERGLSYYDFGGWDDLPGLLQFKESFGAYPINVFNYYTYTYSLKEKLKEIRKLLKKK